MTGEHGFSLVEVLIATALTLSATAVIVSVLDPARDSFRTQTEAADMEQRLRIAGDALRRDLSMAGAGSSRGPLTGPLHGYFAPVLPRHVSDEASVAARDNAITLVYVTETPSQTSIDTAIRAESVTVAVRHEVGCPLGDVLCGFTTGQQVVVYDDAGAFSVFTVTGDTGSALRLRHDLPDTNYVFRAGSTIAAAIGHSYQLSEDGTTGISQLTRDDGARQVPVVNHVVGLWFEYFGDAQPPRITTGGTVEQPRSTYGPAPTLEGAVGYPPGENCVFARDASQQPVPRLSVLTGGGNAPIALPLSLFEDGPWCPNAGHASRFDADLLRVRRVIARVRVQSADASLRGPAGQLFTQGGTARRGPEYLPDFEVSLDVSPRNLHVSQ